MCALATTGSTTSARRSSWMRSRSTPSWSNATRRPACAPRSTRPPAKPRASPTPNSRFCWAKTEPPSTASHPIASTARVVLLVQLPQSLPRYLGVDLRGRNVGVSQQHLHHAQISTVVEQVCRKRMAQGVRRQVLGDARVQRVLLDQLPEHLAAHRITARRHKQGIAHLPAQDLRTRLTEVTRQPV